MSRCFDDGSYDQERWEARELPAYAERARLIGRTVLIANYLAEPSVDASFGSATVLAGNGSVVASYPLSRVGLLVVDLASR